MYASIPQTALANAAPARCGVVCLNNRYHDPTLGQFVSVDPKVVETLEPYVYGSANPIYYSDPTGETPCAFQACPDGIPVVHYDNHDMRSWIWPSLPTDDAKADNGFSKRKEAHDYWTPVDGPAGRLTSDGLTIINAFPFPFGPGDGRECDWRCGLATTVTGVVGYPLASMLCGKGTIVSSGFGSAAICTGSFTAATGLVNVVYESTSNPDADKSDLACAFAFGTSDPAVNVLTSAAGGAATGVANSVSKGVEITSEVIVRDVGTSVGMSAVVGEAGSRLCD